MAAGNDNGNELMAAGNDNGNEHYGSSNDNGNELMAAVMTMVMNLWQQ